MPLLSSLIVNTTAIINVTPLLENLLKIMNEAKSIEINNKSNLNLNKKIELKDISFNFKSKSKNILNKINLKLKKGNIYGLVGLSGAGKTTLINILSGILYPTSGTIAVDGNKILKINLKLLRNFISYIGQDIYIFNGDIIENIIFSDKKNLLVKKIY